MGGFPPTVTISLGRVLPHGSSSLPGTFGSGEPGGEQPMSLLDLAPGGGCLAAGITARAGGLLSERDYSHPWRIELLPFAIAISPLPAVSLPPGGMFLWPDPASCPAPGVTRRHALWSADFPLQADSSLQRSPGQPWDHILPALGREVNGSFVICILSR